MNLTSAIYLRGCLFATAYLSLQTSMELSEKLKFSDIDVKGKRILIRVDFNVPLDSKSFQVTNTQRIDESVPTIKYCLENKAKHIILMSHLGRPDGRVVSKYSLKHILQSVEKSLQLKVIFLNIDSELEKSCSILSEGSVVLLENLRFNIAEEGTGIDENGMKIKASAQQVDWFRKTLTNLGDIYINDAFGTAHRAHSSVVGIDLPLRVAGLLMQKELSYFSMVLESPKRPFLAILGGAKVSDKILLIENLIDKVDQLIIGGGMAYTFKKIIQNMSIGSSLFDEEGSKIVHRLVKKAKEKNVELLLPCDFVIADNFSNDANIGYATDEKGIPDGWMGLDCGPNSIKLFSDAVANSNQLLWNGPMGVFEMSKFEFGTQSLMNAVVNATNRGCISVIGGGDTATCCVKYNTKSFISHVSTGGGASLELLEGKLLPGVVSLTNKKE